MSIPKNAKYTLIITIYLLLTAINSIAQNVNDRTIFYNQNWEICDAPLIAFYRLGKLVIGENSYFSGEVKDYYRSGRLQMEGTYSNTGLKEGLFTYYFYNGRVERKGSFVNGEMKGTWSFSNGRNTILELNCDNDKTFSPLLYITKAGDTIIKDGNGKFEINLYENENIFRCNPSIPIHYLTGSCINGIREGEWNYYGPLDSSSPLKLKKSNLEYMEKYKNGKFIEGRFFIFGEKNQKISTPEMLIAVNPQKDVPIDNFKADFAIQDLSQFRDNLGNFLLVNAPVKINSHSTSFENNIADYINCMAASIRLSSPKISVSSSYPGFHGGYYTLAENIHYYEPGMAADLIPSGIADIHFTVSDAGTVNNLKIESDLPPSLTDPIKYYLSLLNHLKSADQGNNEVGLKLNMESEKGIYSGQNAIIYYVSLSKADYPYSFKDYVIKDSLIVEATRPIFGQKEGDFETYLRKQIKNKPKNIILEATSFSFDFVVDENGGLTDIKNQLVTDAATDTTTNAAAQEFLKSIFVNCPKWKPAELDGKKIASQSKILFQTNTNSNTYVPENRPIQNKYFYQKNIVLHPVTTVIKGDQQSSSGYGSSQ